MEKNINKKLEETLNALVGLEKAEPKPFFYTRLKARMEIELLQPKQVFVWQVKPIYLVATAVVVILINVLTFSILKNQGNTNKNTEKTYSFYDANSL